MSTAEKIADKGQGNEYSPSHRIKYLYSTDYGSDDSSEYASRYPVQKRTPKCLWIDSSQYDHWRIGAYYCADHTEWEPIYRSEQKLHRIPVDDLLRNGYYYSRNTRLFLTPDLPEKWQAIIAGTYTPWNQRQDSQPAAPCFKFFGFDLHPSLEEFKAAYREQALKLHPDHNGDAKQFQEMAANAELCFAFLK